jgi:D-aminoacyl-tRNA deacylase
VRAVLQRVSEASVAVAGETVGAVGPGLVILLGIERNDGEEAPARLAGKVARLRVFADDAGRFDRSLLDVRGEALVVSQFTLIADSKRQKGTRPDFSKAAPKDIAERLYLIFCDALRLEGVVDVQTGVFGARMLVEIANDGPVTIILDT